MDPRASGMAATARATANISASSMGICRYRLSRNTARQISRIPAAQTASELVQTHLQRRFLFPGAPHQPGDPADFVSIPVAVTTALPRPPAARVPAYTILFRSASGTVPRSAPRFWRPDGLRLSANFHSFPGTGFPAPSRPPPPDLRLPGTECPPAPLPTRGSSVLSRPGSPTPPARTDFSDFPGISGPSGAVPSPKRH